MADALAPYDFDLPDALIAQRPAEQRDGSRMLVLHRTSGEIEDRHVTDLPEYLASGDALVFNDTRVMAARLLGHRPTGGKAELFLIERREDGLWRALAKPGRKLREGAEVWLGGESGDAGSGARGLRAEVVGVEDDGKRLVRFTRGGGPLAEAEEREALDEIGQLPLPPYIARPTDRADRERYQTIFARESGAVAAPTAGLHFTDTLLGRLEAGGVGRVHVTLHVGYGTFEPVKAEDLADHRVAAERIAVTPEASGALNRVRAAGGRIVAVGTTSTRTLETSADASGTFYPASGATDLTVTPGYTFTGVDALLTNFHLPKSSLLVLTSTFGGRENVMRAYRHAVAERYRFYSYGDCMLIL
ncbi:tRNA preQ1(34) S-adenosylmethionine ribosyltransferase-isomerase QueA [Rubricoccus marinus]|uniref:S-adenosylmethionine:tRNA ribosyltransferase-isomerase n=1 Tax=Rubricoccus marinus TaxID=716817 RepID=A0A259TZZ2_9BACT|nr:tRNA preQ1(34) S-adenosylmethionine ribosyltransferase-isomerase QueA [Rubricoccus marinus]OZC03353.1 tRNA preQ1(34) S-adenosylmethionine ribosyltransferase-isomerase QueA [Rubricoccus marinus]